MINKKGQGTIEYLIIIAIVVVLALVVVSFLLGTMENMGGISQTQSQTAWRSAEPWAIVEWRLVGSDENLDIVLRNNSFETLGFNSVSIGAGTPDTTAQNVAPAATITKTITGLSGYTAGNRFSIQKDDIAIDFNSGNINNRIQRGVADIVGTVQ